MNHPITRIASFMLAFGIFFSISCSSLEKTESAERTDFNEESLQQEIRKIDQEISQNPGNTGLRADKAGLLFRYSQTIPDPANRKPVYINIRDLADSYSSRSESNSDPFDEVLVKAWRTEQRSGIKLLQNDRVDGTEENTSAIISHFENAIILIPDSLQTYSLLATTHYQNGNLNQAIETLEATEQRGSRIKPEISEKLAYLYLESGDLAEAERRYTELVENHPENLLYKHGLVNVRILSEKHEETIALLEQLSEKYPARYTYKESLATELYYLFRDKTDRYIQDAGPTSLSADERRELTNLLNSIHSIFESIQDSLPASEENLSWMAAFYKNASLRLKNLSTADNDDDSFSELREEFTEYSLPLWEQLADLNPENLGYISNLYQAYLELGMEEEAEAIERSYNF